MTSDERDLRALHVTWIDAVNAGDLPRLLELLSDDAVLFSPGQPPFGREQFAETFSAAHGQWRIRCVSEPEEVAVSGDMAFTRCKDSLSLTPAAGGATSRFAGDRLTVYRKGADGRWRLSRDAHTLMPVD